MNIKLPKADKSDQTTALRRVQEATAAHARTRRDLDDAIADATAAGVQPEALQQVGQVEPGHGKHAGEVDIELAGLAVAD
ncbi:hypothetical protein [Streptacidiphilus sp. P02-A3a]|uniref:hypothetical protein n=1 Tax=Streptacidiphilus sp. P02-A3a TaxID=2704468 RepID=UPI0015FB6186|nr:hypothetical protein [Streptacidiphilus sp. P02-A3a]QMU72002.1 hypothetical protein GXP74_30975 [Streptacidiphilus sp. P02-A3a]